MTSQVTFSRIFQFMMSKYFRYILCAILFTGLAHILYALYFKPVSVHVQRQDYNNPTNKVLDDAIANTASSPSQEVDLRIIVITFNRAASLARCLESLNQAEYYGDKVHVDIWIDRSKKDGSINNQTYTSAVLFDFKHGTVDVHRRVKHAGLYGQWMTTWVPAEDTKEIAIFIEDDLTMSKYFYKWLKLVHKKYDSVPYINGFSAQGKSIKHAGDPGMLHGPETEVVFSYPVLGSWGFSPSPKNWHGFLKWYSEASKDASFVPNVPGLQTTVWYNIAKKAGKTENIWTQWHIYYAHQHKELTVYVNLPYRQGLAINWEEPGLHYQGSSKKTNNDPLLKTWDDKYADLPDVPVQLDAHGKVVKSAQYRKISR